MEKVDTLIIGAGVVGLAIAAELAKCNEDIVVVEKEKSFGRHTSSRNSEVIHSGLYYPQNTLKATLCVRGVDLLYDYLESHDVAYDKCGKLIVAADPEEEVELWKLKANGEKNGVKGMTIIDHEQCRILEPQIKAHSALLVPATGIVDTHGLMQSLAQEAENNDAFLVYDMEVTAIKKSGERYQVEFADSEIFDVRRVINAAGLWSDRIAEMIGIDIHKHDLQLHWCKGEYYKTNKIKGIKHLVYPLPDNISLGIHLTINLAGLCRFGPSAYYVDDLNYSMDESYKAKFLESINKYLDLPAEFLELDDTGIRPKLQKPDEKFRDFYIKVETEKGFPNFINTIGIESPGLTAALAIAEYVNKLLE